MNHTLLMTLLIIAPFVGFLVNGLRYRRHSALVAGTISSLAILVSLVSAVALVADLIALPAESRIISVRFFEWIALDRLKINAGFMVDQISAIMILVVTGVGFLIHIFSIGYMSHDKGVAKYFAYLNLFVFSMLILVLGDSLLTMFVGWEGVGLCSYLLIGFWFTDKEKAAAGMKAFVTNRIGDAAFLLGIFVLFISFGTLNFSDLNALAPTTVEASWMGAATLGTLFLFIGATGKSAQIPLYVWLPDAMAGPTPVSALIHAATMVTAGVYMIVRLNPLFMSAPNTMMVIAIVGALTALMAALIGMTQWDIKKVLAYSTVSQLGYMFLACGVGAFGAAMFHLMTHAFFKALMFLGSGSVIHAMNSEQDIRKMGGLKKALPITHATFIFGWLAIIGIPPFAGFFSKDEILMYAFHSPLGSPWLWAVGFVGAALTAFYMTRLVALTFWGKGRVPNDIKPHEAPWSMTLPLIILAILSLVGGWIGVPHIIGEHLGHMPNVWEQWLHPVIKTIPDWQPMAQSTEWVLIASSVGIAALSAVMAWRIYSKGPEGAANATAKIKPLYKVVSNKFYVDEMYSKYLIEPLISVSKNLWDYLDVRFIDRTAFVAGDVAKGMGSIVRSLQSGNMQQYAMYIGIGVVVVLSFVIMR